MKDNSQKARVAALLFPPAGLAAFWLLGEIPIRKRIMGSITTILYAVLYAALIVWLLMKFAGLEVEWKGGFPPVLTFQKTIPDYERLEKHRASLSATNQEIRAKGGIYWTGFRGPRRDGIYDERPLKLDWSAAGLTPIWRQPIGGGYSSFAIAEGIAFTLEQRRDREAVTAYDMATGREVWAYTYLARFEEWMGGEGPRSTPTWDNGLVYALGAKGDLHCLRAISGEVVWKTNVLSAFGGDDLMFATAYSPLIVGEKLILLPGGTSKSVVALDKATGKPLWTALSDKQAYVSPIYVSLAGSNQLLIVSATRVMGLAAEDGKLLWSFPWAVQYENSIAQPVIIGTNRFLLSAGYGTGAVVVEVSETGGTFSAKEIWRNKRLKNKFASSVYYKGYIYGLDEDILTCLDANTGKQQWKDGRYGYGQLLLAQGHLIILGGEGKLAVVKADPAEHRKLVEFQAIKGKTWNPPALADGFLLVRNAVEAACFDLR